MQPPVWPQFPEAGRFADLHAKAPISANEPARANAQALAVMLKEAGINVNCLPLLDVRQEGAHDIIGVREIGAAPMQVTALCSAVLQGIAGAGVVGVVNHVPSLAAQRHVEKEYVTACNFR